MKPPRTKDADLSFPAGSATPNNLPVQLTSFIGREEAIAEIGRLLTEARIVTLTGSGGCGKTRLALQAGAQALGTYPDGVWWVDLAPLTDPALVPSTVAAAMSIREVPKQPLGDTITNELRERRALIVLDNCEHLVEACAGFAETILRSCPVVSILATSRHTIDVEGEVAFRVPSLGLPEEGEPGAIDTLTQYEAVRLFIDRALRARPNFRVTNENAPAVAHICHRLDGIPLAIELAAARTRMLSVERIADELTDLFHVLTGGARTVVPRHQTLRASVEWSFGLLIDNERTLLRRLSVFSRGFTLDAAEEVGAGDGIDRNEVLDLLSSLVDKSLVQAEETGPEVRYRLLETIRQYGVRELAEAGEEESVRARHLALFTALAERAEPKIEGAELLEWMQVLRTERDNIRSALEWSLSAGEPETGLRLAGALGIFWFVDGNWSEARQRYESLLAREIPDPAIRAKGLVGASTNSFQLFDNAAAYRFAEEAAAVAREVDDRWTLARALSLMGTARMWLGDFEGARPLLEESVEVGTETGDSPALARAYFGLANGWWIDAGDLVRARSAFEEGLAAARASGSPFRIGYLLALFGAMNVFVGDLDQAEALVREARQKLEDVGELAFRAISIGSFAWARLLRGDHEVAGNEAEQAVLLATKAAHPGALSQGRFVLGWLHRARGDFEAATAELEQSATLGRAMNTPGWGAFWLIQLAVLRVERGALDAAESAVEEAAGLLGEPRGFFRGLLADARARVARKRGDLERAESLGHEALRSLAEADAKPWLLDLLEFVAWAAAAHESDVEAVRLFAAAESARSRLGYVRFQTDQERFDEDLERSRSALGPEEFERAWAEGAAMSLEEAVAYARRGRGERKRPSAGWASLTPTELEVAGLVAARLTNPQIAERLFVSRGTVKAHLSHIYAKLDIASRAELADEVVEHQP